MKRVLLMFTAIALSACSTAPKRAAYSPPSTIAVRAKVLAAQVHVAKVKLNVASADSHIVAAQKNAEALLQVAPFDLRPMVSELQSNLVDARKDLSEAAQRAEAAEVKLVESGTKTEELQVQVDKQTETFVSAVNDKNDAIDKAAKLEVDRNLQRKLAWKWRLYCALGALAVGAFFVARQYFPFLKFI